MMVMGMVILFAACSKPDDEVSADKEIKVRELVSRLAAENPNCSCAPFLDEYTWRGQTIYALAFSGPGCNWIPSYYNVEGVKIEMAAGYQWSDFREEATRVRNRWTCGVLFCGN